MSPGKKTNDPQNESPLEQEKRKRERSPNFPSIDLETALARLDDLYRKDKMHEVSINLIHERWGFAKMSGSMFRTVAALSAFGLAKSTGSGDKRKISITENGRKILCNHSEKEKLITDAALQPTIFKEIWDKYEGQLPQDDVIRQYLVFDRDGAIFNESSANMAIDRLKKTVLFAGLDKTQEKSDEAPFSNNTGTADQEDPPTLQNGNKITSNNEVEAQSTLPTKQTPGHKTFTLPLMDGDVAVIQVPHPMGKENFEVFMAILGAMKSSLVGSTNDPEKKKSV